MATALWPTTEPDTEPVAAQLAALHPQPNQQTSPTPPLTSTNTVGPVGLEPTTRGLKVAREGVRDYPDLSICAGQDVASVQGYPRLSTVLQPRCCQGCCQNCGSADPHAFVPVPEEDTDALVTESDQ